MWRCSCLGRDRNARRKPAPTLIHETTWQILAGHSQGSPTAAACATVEKGCQELLGSPLNIHIGISTDRGRVKATLHHHTGDEGSFNGTLAKGAGWLLRQIAAVARLCSMAPHPSNVDKRALKLHFILWARSHSRSHVHSCRAVSIAMESEDVPPTTAYRVG